MQVLRPTVDDLIVWPDGTYCYRDELAEFSYKSDDYEVLSFDTPAYVDFCLKEGLQ